MACNCSKNRTASPTGFGRAGRDAQTAQLDKATLAEVEHALNTAEARQRDPKTRHQIVIEEPARA